MQIIRDSREKKGYWVFAGKRCKVQGLKTGDYTLKGFEDVLCIERKKTVMEIAGNFTHKSGAFWREVDRMAEFPHAYLILEFTQDELLGYPWKSDIPKFLKRKIRIRGGYLATKLEIIEERGIKVIFAGDRDGAIAIAERIFEEFQDEHSV